MGSISERLIELQGEMSARKFAKLLGIKTSTLWEYLHGRDPPIGNLALIARRMHVDVSWLITGEGEKHYVHSSEPSEKYTLAMELDEIIARLSDLKTRLRVLEEKSDEHQCEA